MERSPHQTSGNDQHKRLVVGWFSFTCCEDNTILFTELLNDHFDDWKKAIEFRHIKALKTNNSLSGLDVAFIEGAISSESQADRRLQWRRADRACGAPARRNRSRTPLGRRVRASGAPFRWDRALILRPSSQAFRSP